MDEGQLAFGWTDDGAALPPEPLPRMRPLAAKLRQLADRGVYLGTSSWKYPGWLGQVYTPARYRRAGRLAERKFEQDCLAEYATIFPTVGGDFSFYQFPSPQTWQRIFSQVPPGFRFSLKVPEAATVERFPNLRRYREQAGTDNPHFMDGSLVKGKLLDVLEPYRDRLGVLVFEFGAIHRAPMNRPRQFAAALDRLLSALPSDRFSFAVEVRNPEFLQGSSDYLACLRAHQVAHCLNSWTRMPPIGEQLGLPEVFPTGHVAARLLLRPGRTYQQAVDRFAPYERVQEPYPEGRAALRELIERCLSEQRTLFAFVNNRFEGNAVETIEETVRDLE